MDNLGIIAVSIIGILWLLRRFVNLYISSWDAPVLCQLGYHRWTDYGVSGGIYFNPPGIRDLVCAKCPAQTTKRAW